MKAVWPTANTAALQALLATRRFAMAECFELTTVYGDVLRWTTAQYPVTVTPPGGVSPVTYTSGGVSGGLLVDGQRMHASVGASVDEQTITVTAKPTDLIGQLPVLTAIRFGLTASTFGSRTVRTPILSSAVILSAATLSATVNTRW